MRITKSFLLLSFVTFLFSMVHSQPPKPVFLFIGSYTKALPDQGITVYEFNPATGAMTFRSVIGGIENPSYLAIDKTRNIVYTVSEKNGGQGIVVAYRFDPATATLARINEASSGGEGPCYVSVDAAGTHVFAANYGSGSLGAISLNKDGSLNPEKVQSIQHRGNSINKENQAGPHVHSAILTPDNRYVLSADLGTDRVHIYQFDQQAEQSLHASEMPFASTKPGSGPRHITIHPNGKYVYVVNELNGTVDAFDYHNGVLQAKQTITMLPDGFAGIIEAADIHISPDGKFLYASNREIRNEIIIYAIGKNGTLSFKGRQPVLGAVPRNFVIDRSGKFLLVANLKTNEVMVFNRNSETGLLIPAGQKISINAPSCLKFY
jgi:6-phosphogluconolactonase